MQHILIVESDAQIRKLLEYWLAEAGHSIVHSQADAEEHPDLVIADLGSSATEVESRVQELRRTHHPAPLLLISGRFRRGLASSRTAALLMGVQAVLPTPFSRAELLSAVASAGLV